MAKNSLQQLNEQVKFQHIYWESLSPEERRAAVIQMRDAQLKNARQSIVFLAVIGLLFSAITLYIWFNEYHLSLSSSLGVIGGSVLAAIGFQYVKSNRIKSISKLETDNFTDEDVIAYFREHEEVNQRAFEQWNRNKYLIFILGGLLIFLLNLRSTADFVFMAFGSGISIFLLVLSVFFMIEKGNKR